MNSCNKCGGDNEVTVTDTLDGHTITEASTKCDDCGFEDYWAYGWYESGQDGYNSCGKYIANQCRI